MGKRGDDTPGKYGPQKLQSYVTGDAKAMLDAFRVARVRGAAREFLDILTKYTFGDAGFHAAAGHDPTACAFDLIAWARELGWAKSQVIAYRMTLIQRQIIWFLPDPAMPGRGRIGWQMDFRQWQATGHGGARSGAGRRQQDSSHERDIQVMYASLPSKTIQVINANDSSHTCPPAENDFKSSMAVSSEASTGAAPSAPKERLRKKGRTDANASPGDAAFAAVAADDLPSPEFAASDVPSAKHAHSPKASSVFAADSREYRIAAYLRTVITSYAPQAKLPAESTGGLAPWCAAIRLMLEVDHRQPADIRRVIDFVAREPFWQAHILGAKKLREKFDTLDLQSKRNGRGASNGTENYRRGSTIGQAPATEAGYANDPNDVIE